MNVAHSTRNKEKLELFCCCCSSLALCAGAQRSKRANGKGNSMDEYTIIYFFPPFFSFPSRLFSEMCMLAKGISKIIQLISIWRWCWWWWCCHCSAGCLRKTIDFFLTRSVSLARARCHSPLCRWPCCDFCVRLVRTVLASVSKAQPMGYGRLCVWTAELMLYIVPWCCRWWRICSVC